MPHIDAVIPLLPKDLDRFSILAHSLARFVKDLGTLYVAVPPAALERTRSALASRFPALSIRVLCELDWVPEMGSFLHLPGWYKQQLVKLAAAQYMSSDFYLTLDADVVCTRRAGYDDLVPGGRARCHVMPNNHLDWYQGAEAVLDLRAKRDRVLHNVTPCVWSRAGVLELIERLNEVAQRAPYATGIRGLQQRVFFNLYRMGPHRRRDPWRGWLAASRPWAEYAMYFTFLEATGRFDRYHFESDECIYDVERSVWYEPAFAAFDPAPLFAGQGPPYFVVIQSNTGIAAERTWGKLEPYLAG